MKDLKDPLTLEELTEKVIALDERVTRLETLIEQHEKTFARIEARLDRLEARIDRFFWLWVGTVAAGIILRLLHL